MGQGWRHVNTQGGRKGEGREGSRAKAAGARARTLYVDLLHVSQIALIPYQHGDDRRIGMRAQLPQPSLAILKALTLCDVIHKQGTDGAGTCGCCALNSKCS